MFCRRFVVLGIDGSFSNFTNEVVQLRHLEPPRGRDGSYASLVPLHVVLTSAEHRHGRRSPPDQPPPCREAPLTTDHDQREPPNSLGQHRGAYWAWASAKRDRHGRSPQGCW